MTFIDANLMVSGHLLIKLLSSVNCLLKVSYSSCYNLNIFIVMHDIFGKLTELEEKITKMAEEVSEIAVNVSDNCKLLYDSSKQSINKL